MQKTPSELVIRCVVHVSIHVSEYTVTYIHTRFSLEDMLYILETIIRNILVHLQSEERKKRITFFEVNEQRIILFARNISFHSLYYHQSESKDMIICHRLHVCVSVFRKEIFFLETPHIFSFTHPSRKTLGYTYIYAVRNKTRLLRRLKIEPRFGVK